MPDPTKTDSSRAHTGHRSSLGYEATTQERTVLALERIADELSALSEYLFGQFQTARSNPDFGSDDAEPNVSAEIDSWDNERGGFNAGHPPALRVVRNEEESFSVGGYRYTNLQHAIEEAKRARLAASKATDDSGEL